MKLRLGPGALVAAAFIGPGTVTACTLAGANFGFALIWTLVFATLATITLQDMSARLGAGAGLGLGEALMAQAGPVWSKALIGGLVFAALVVGNAAYQAGNLAGGALGLEALAGGDQRTRVSVIAAIAGAVLLIGRYKALERVLIGLVLVMSATFAIAAVLSRPDLGALAAGLVPRIPEGGWLTAVALVGTTIVPYNLFLHAAAARERWAGDVASAQADTRLSIGLGGLVSILILTTAAGALFGAGADVSSAADMARGLEPTLGSAADYVIGVGLFAAGLTSAITAPMATAYVVAELVGVRDQPRRRRLFRIVSLAVLVIGAAVALSGVRPVALILIAQAANGILLPIVAVFLLIVMNRRSLLGDHANGAAANIAGWTVVALAFALGARGVLRAAGVWP
ncbi:MAG: Nramp family divalent metal transporter [Pseudomonadota bacterium]